MYACVRACVIVRLVCACLSECAYSCGLCVSACVRVLCVSADNFLLTSIWNTMEHICY